MKRSNLLIYITVMLVSVIALLTFHVAPFAFSASNSLKVVKLTAKQFAFKPESIRVNIGEEVLFKITSQDITHGFYIDGYDIFVDIPPGETVEVGPIKFDKPGKFKIRCATLCGPLHPFMVADIVVEPNVPFYIILVGAMVVAVAFLLFIKRRSDKMSSEKESQWEIDLLKMKTIGPLLKKILQWRGVHFFLILPNLLIFVIVLMTGFFGNPLGALNFSIAVVWILWFAAVEFMILFASRIWCCVCPMPAFGEWLARRRLCTVHDPRKWFSLRRRWPKSLNNIWVASLGFLSISLFVPWLVTRPFISGLLFILLIALAFVLHLIFAERYFCLHICPASGYIGYHSASSMLAVRSRDKKICDEHTAKECVRGSPKGYGCPWKRYPGGNDWNAYCGLCFECLKSCPLDNMTLKFRALDKDILKRVRTRIDEAWMGFIRFTLALFYIVVFFGPYFWIKDWGNMGVNFGANLLTAHLLIPTFQGFKNWLGWAVIVSSMSLLIFPAVFFVFSWLAKKVANHKEVSAKQVFLAFSYSLSSYGHFLWIAFAISLLAVNWAYPLRAFSDPFGWGWNLIGTGDIAWRPFMPHLLPYIQAPIVFLGLGFALMATYHIGLNLFKDKKKAFRASVVMGILHTLVALLFVYIVMG